MQEPNVRGWTELAWSVAGSTYWHRKDSLIPN
jgi:hypothetical protein